MSLINKVLFKIASNFLLLRVIADKYERSRNHIANDKTDVLQSGYSFVIVTDGRSTDNLKKSMNSIIDEFDGKENFEIIVIGQNDNYPIINNHIRYISYYGVSFLPGWITLKKNLGALSASYDKLVIMHDYLALCKGWLRGYIDFSDEYEVCTNKIQFIDGRRARDWTVLDYPGIGWGLFPYSQYSDYLYISGAYFVVKTKFYKENLLDENLRWGEAEDVEWTCRIRGKTKIRLNLHSCCQFVKVKPQNEAPYENSWIEKTIELYHHYGYSLTRDNFEIMVKNN